MVNNLIKDKRIEKEYKVEDLAKDIGVSIRQYYRLEKGQVKRLNLNMLDALHRVLGLPYDQLIEHFINS